jgi:predicted MFS family arabinose efflux permease
VLAEAAPAWSLVALAGLAGAATPPLVASMRVEWQRVLGEGAGRLVQAYAFESSAQTGVFVVGPLLAGAVIALAGARVALGASAAALLVGTLAFAAVAGTPPPPERARAGSPIRLPGVLTLVLVTALADVALGAIDVLVTAFAEQRGRPALAGVLLAVFAGSAVVGALAYGMRSWPLPPALQLLAILLAGTTTIALLALPTSPLALAALLALAGGPSAAQWAASSVALDAASGGRGGAEAFTWLSTANGIGIAVGSVLGGAAVERWGVATAFLLAAAGPACAAAVIAARRATLTP